MKKSFKVIISISAIISVFILIALSSCDNDKVYDAPEIGFVQEEGFIYTDTVIALSEDIKIGIHMKSNSDQPITHFNRTIDRDGDVSTLENPLFDDELTITTTEPKSLAETEVWSFYCRDRDGRQSDTISLTISLEGGALFGDIRIIEELEFGAQSNEEDGSFYSLADEKQYNLTDAYANQGKVDLLYYFDNLDTDENTISSPGASIPSSIFSGQMGLANWTVRNTTRFIQMGGITRQEFEACANDSLILANTFDFETGKRKAKNLAEGEIYAFVTDKGIQGLFMVKGVEGQEAGNVRISLKMRDE